MMQRSVSRKEQHHHQTQSNNNNKSPQQKSQKQQKASPSSSSPANSENNHHNHQVIVESTSCGCSLPKINENLPNLGKPGKCKLSQIWPLFKHVEFNGSTPIGRKLNDRLNNHSAAAGHGAPALASTPASSGRRRLPRSPSPQPHRRKSLFTGISLQRDSYIDVSKTMRPKQSDESSTQDNHHKEQAELEDDINSIPMGRVVCTAKAGSPCSSCDNGHQDHSSLSPPNDNNNMLNIATATEDKFTEQLIQANRAAYDEFRSRNRSKRLKKTSPRTSTLYTAVESEFKRLGIYKERSRSADHMFNQERNSELQPNVEEEKLPSPSSSNLNIEEDQTPSEEQFEIKAYNPICQESQFNVQNNDQHHHHLHNPNPKMSLDHDSFDYCRRSTATRNACSNCENDDDYHTEEITLGYSNDNEHQLSINGNSDRGDETPDMMAVEGIRFSDHHPMFNAGISQKNVIESFLTLSNALCMTQFSQMIKKVEASLQRFSSYLVKAKYRALAKENPGQAPPHKHDIIVSMIQSWMPYARFASSHHFKYGLQACISKVLFEQFETYTYGSDDVDESMRNPINRQFMFLRAYYVLEALNNCSGEQLMEFNTDFQKFCHRKLEAMKSRIGWVSRWPSKLLETFLVLLKDVWMAHKLAFAFEKPACMFFAEPKAQLNLEYMNPLVEAMANDHQHQSFKPSFNMDINKQSFKWHEVVQFTVFPGFSLGQEGVVQSIVYLKPKVQGVLPCDYQRSTTYL